MRPLHGKDLMSNKIRKALAAAAPPPEPVQRRYVRVADEDDDRYYFQGVGGYVNPIYARHIEAGTQGHGWNPALTMRIATGKTEYPYGDQFIGYQGTVGVFHAQFQPPIRQITYWRIICIGGDDWSTAKTFNNEKKARATWEKIRDHITIRTLRRWGFRPE